MQTKTFIKCLIFLVILFIGFSISYAELYSGGPWRGRVIDADTKEPIEGAVVVAVWQREYDGPFEGITRFHEAKEVLTDKEGKFEMPAYIVESKEKPLLREQDLKKNEHLLTEEMLQQWKIVKPLYSGPEIKEPKFIIYKPSYGNYPGQEKLGIYAIGPGSSIVEYQEEHKEMYKGKMVTAWAKKRTKTFPEGLVYYGARCKTKIDAMKKTLPFNFGFFFIPMGKAKEKVERLEIPLDCPENGEPIPGSSRGFRDDIVNPLHSNKGGYIIIELPKLRTKENRDKAIPSIPDADEDKLGEDKLPLLYKVINEEHKYLGLPEIWRKRP